MNEDKIVFYLDANDPLNDKMIQAGFERIPEQLFEHKTYQSLGKTGYCFRGDKANNAPVQQQHYHVYKDDKGMHQIFAINKDGTPHDGSRFSMSKKLVDALKSLGIAVPSNGILESAIPNCSSGRQLLLG